MLVVRHAKGMQRRGHGAEWPDASTLEARWTGFVSVAL
jgi:hypothetical protein